MAANYSAGSIQVLKGLEAVRKRPGMYIGSTGPKGLHHLVYETVDNCIDEAMAGFCDTIVVALEKDDIVRVEDNGRGIPVDIHPTEKVSALELVLTRLHAGGKFDKNAYKVSGGLHGVGVSCVNALSDWMEATIKRDGHIYQQKYERGVPKSKVDIIGDVGPDEHGTTIRWKADKTIFTETTTYDYDILRDRLRELAFLNSGVVIVFRDERLENPKEEVLKFEGGINEFVKEIDEGKAVVPAEPIYIKEERDDVVTEISMHYNSSYSENVRTFVNDINTRDGGTHLEGFRSAVRFVLNKFFEGNEKLKKNLDKDEKLTYEDLSSGLTAVISMKVPEPEFEGQTKEKLGNTEVRTIVDQIVKEKLTIYFEQNPTVLEAILKKAIDEAKARIAARKAKDNMRKKTMSDGFGLPEKLSDCSMKNPEMCEVYIVEGDSAGGSAKKGRDPKTQAILPLWGKMLNVEKVRPEKVMNNDKLEPVIASLGAGFGKDFNIDKLRYHKIIIMADADVDGAHIATLIMTFFFRHMKELIEQGYLYIAMAPLYQCSKGNYKEYCWNDMQRRAFIENYAGGDEKQVKTQRYKGLGEMSDEQLWETTMDPARRMLKQVTIENAAEADRTISMLMGEEVAPRREFIEQNATYAKIDA